MRAIVQREFGGPEVLVIGEADLPDGRVHPLVDEYALERAADAHAAIEKRRQRGKVVLIP